MTDTAGASETKIYSCVRGYHVYQDHWVLVQDETLQCSREVCNAHALYAVKVTKAGMIVEHLPCTIKKQETAIIKLYIIHMGNKITHNAPLATCSYDVVPNLEAANQ